MDLEEAKLDRIEKEAARFFRGTSDKLFRLAEQTNMHPLSVKLALQMMLFQLDGYKFDERYITPELLARLAGVNPGEVLAAVERDRKNND